MLKIQIILIIFAFCLSLFGIYKTIGMNNSTNRIIIYSGQAIACLAIIIFGFVYFNKKETKYFRSVIISYGLLEAIRASLLQTSGVDDIYSFLAKFLLVLLACDCFLLSNKVEEKEGYYLSLTMVGYEIALFLVFLIGFPSVKTRILYISLPFVGILIASTMCLFIKGRLMQRNYTKLK